MSRARPHKLFGLLILYSSKVLSGQGLIEIRSGKGLEEENIQYINLTLHSMTRTQGLEYTVS